MDSPVPRPDPRKAFALRLTQLFAAAGDPSLKRVADSVTLARRLDEQGRPVRVTAQRISDWRRGQNVPARFSALAPVLEVLIGRARRSNTYPPAQELHSLKAWQVLWEKALATPANTSSDAREDRTVRPYQGLPAFDEGDASRFFGRERNTTALLAQLDSALDDPGIVMLTGASGAGKSSLLLAGLVPAIRKGEFSATDSAQWPVVTITPTVNPIHELTRKFPRLATFLSSTTDQFETGIREMFATYARDIAGGDARVVLVVDQFEEAFIRGANEHNLRMFVDILHAASTAELPGGTAPALVVVGVRADFRDHCLNHPELAEALRNRQLAVDPITVAELNDVIVRPAETAGLHLEDGLVELMLGEFNADMHSAGALALLSQALLGTWQRRLGDKLTVGGYRETGGIAGVVAASAERAWAALSPAGKVAARAQLLRLVQVDTGSCDTRRRVARRDIVELAGQPDAAEEALELLIQERLVTAAAEWVEITHETLLSAWPRLCGWIDDDRAGHIVRQRLEDDARRWHDSARNPSLLYRGTRLGNVHHWARSAAAIPLTQVAREFLARSARLRLRQVWVRRATVAAAALFILLATAVAVGVIH